MNKASAIRTARTATTQDHIPDIRKAQEEYLAEISKTLKEVGIRIDEGDEFEDDD